MSDQSQQELGLQIKELEKDKLREEIKQLKESARKSWIAPAVWIAVLPLLGGFGLWIVGEFKQYNMAYQALEEVGNQKQEREALKREKSELNTEILRLLAQKADYATTAKHLEEAVAREQGTADRLAKEVGDRRKEIENWKKDFAAQTAKLDQFYLQIAFAIAETRYALGHITASPMAGPKALQQIRDNLKALPEDEAKKLDELLRDYQFAFEMSKEADTSLAKQSQDIRKVAVSNWTQELQWAGPRGSVIRDRSIMVTKGSDKPQRYYDVELGKFVTKE